MASPKMGIFDNLKDLVTKGPKGMVNERMKESLSMSDELSKLDRSDPEAMRRYTAERNAQVNSVLGSRFGKNFISPENQTHIEQLQNQAIDNQAAFYRMLKEQQAAKGETGASTPSKLTDPSKEPE